VIRSALPRLRIFADHTPASWVRRARFRQSLICGPIDIACRRGVLSLLHFNPMSAIISFLLHGKEVFVFEQHHYALIPWAALRRRLRVRPRLITFDYHTDTRPAFVGFATQQDSPKWRQISKREVAAIDFSVDATIESAVSRLRYDEHIDAAVRAGILDIAFVVATYDNGHIVSNEQKTLDNSSERFAVVSLDGKEQRIRLPGRPLANPPFTYKIPNNKIVVLPRASVPEDEDSSIEGLDRAYRNAALESLFIADRIELVNSICSTAGRKTLFQRPYILDVDLDYFNTKKAIAPSDAAAFHGLIRGASIITIALESSCVESLQLPNEGLTSTFLKDELIRLIESALAPMRSASLPASSS
jgi:hypothetical protein